jgi:hypothetical protein
MNGEALLLSRFPCGSWCPVGTVASVKWLTDIEVTDEPFAGYFQVDRYQIDGEPLTLQRAFTDRRAPARQAVEPGDIVVRGVAWSGPGPSHVLVAIDGGPWQLATLVGERRRHSWQWWELPMGWETTGDFTVRARATDMAGRAQPDRPCSNPLGYANNAVHEVVVSVRAS